jgi:hypothetical protein
MAKSTRPDMHKSIRAGTREPARRGKQSAQARGRGIHSKPKLLIERLDRDIDLVAPRGYHASVLLKLAHREDGHRIFSWWLVAGRHDMDAVHVPYKHTGEEIIRVDLPDGMPLSSESLEPRLAEFLLHEGTEPPDPPIIKG